MHKLQATLPLLLLLPFGAFAEPRDPTMPANLPPPISGQTDQPHGEQALMLTGIRIAADSRHAIINGITVKPGEQLTDDTRVIKITHRYVMIRQNDISKKLYLVPSIKSR